MSDGWSEASGWIAAIVSCLSFGSFAVPIKSKDCQRIDVDPLVFQSYKTAMCLFTSWVALPMGQRIYFTPWGIISALFWVPAGVAAIFAVKNAGLAISQGLWSSIIVIVSFTWGIFIFHEQVKSISGALIAVGLMIIGLWGMSFYSSPAFQSYEQVHSISSLVDIVPTSGDAACNDDGNDGQMRGIRDDTESVSASYSVATNHISLSPTRTATRSYDQEQYEVVHSLDADSLKKYDDDLSLEHDDDHNNNDDDDGLSYNSAAASKRSQFALGYNSSNVEIEQDTNEDYFVGNPTFEQSVERQRESRSKSIILSKRALGLLSALFNGVWGGSIMVPMHYAPEDAHGIGYVFSFAVGATIITICLWIARFGYYYFHQGMTARGSYHSLPPMHFRVMWKPGGIAGLLWSIGNLSSMISVQKLGEGVGYSVTQASMLVSGMWGIFYFREVEGFGIRTRWFISALITIAGILMLSFEHVNDGQGSSENAA